MSMDDVFSTMNAFQQELVEFNDRLNASFDDLAKHHDIVDPLWNDAMRKQYDAKWLQLDEQMTHYISMEGGGYVGILVEKIEAIREYLYGN